MMEKTQYKALGDKIFKMAILILLLFALMQVFVQKQEQIDNLTIRVGELEQDIKFLYQDTEDNRRDIETNKSLFDNIKDDNIGIRDTIDWQTTETNNRITLLQESFDEVSAQRLFVTEDD